MLDPAQCPLRDLWGSVIVSGDATEPHSNAVRQRAHLLLTRT